MGFLNKGKRIASEKSKNLWKFFLALFIISFFILNWNDLSWIFSPRIYTEGIKNVVTSSFRTKNQPFYEEENSIKIEKIDITAPIIIPKGNSNNDFDEALKHGVTYFPSSAFPGEKGLLILLGHSAPLGYPKINYDWIFSRISELEKGDEIIIYFNNAKYIYKVVDKVFLEKGEEVKPQSERGDLSEIILLSCWPLGKDIQRIGIRGVLAN